MAPKAHWLTRAQALKALGLETATAAELLALEQKAPESTQGKIARHLRKWLPADDSITTVPLEEAEAKALGLKPAE